MSVKMAASYERLKKYDKTLSAYTDFKNYVHVIHDDGSSYIIWYAHVTEDPEDNNYLWIIGEHQPLLIFHKEDLSGWKIFSDIGE